MDRLIGRQIDGLVGSIFSLPESARALLDEAGVPVLYLGPEPLTSQTSVSVDNVLDGRLAVEHLYDQGHRRILFLGSDEPSALLRAQGAREALDPRGDVRLEMRL